ncbi:MAG: hypothetical protein ACKVS5_08750 [Parvularculaceae bacterium]
MTKALTLLIAAAMALAAIAFTAALARSGEDPGGAARRLCAETLCGVIFF